MSPAEGTVISGNVRLLRPLARGGMGSVWIADHLGLKSRVAVKFVDESIGTDAGVLARFSREAAAAARMRSPHVVQIFDHGCIDERIPYIVMELLEGESLGQRIERRERLDLEETAVVIQQTCKALTRAHSLGIVHRDIKPDNLFITDADGEIFVKVLDFGIAKVEADGSPDLTSSGTTVGTPNYASPEQLLSAKSATPSADLWAVAATAYRALTGYLPFHGETFAALCLSITRGQFTPPRVYRPELPAAMDAWFARALDVTPERRFGTARELAEQFAIAAGLGARGSALSAASTLPAPAEGADSALRDPRSSSASGPRTQTIATPGMPFRPPASRGTGPSIAAASVNAGETIRTARPGRTLVLATLALILAASTAAFLLGRRGADPASLAVPPGAAGLGEARSPVAPPSAPPPAPGAVVVATASPALQPFVPPVPESAFSQPPAVTTATAVPRLSPREPAVVASLARPAPGQPGPRPSRPSHPSRPELPAPAAGKSAAPHPPATQDYGF